VAPGLVEPARLDRELLDEDAWRIEIFYANQGYFDARFLGWEIVPRGRPGARRHEVRGHVVEGEPSRFRGVETVGVDRLPAPIRRRVARLVGAPGADVRAGETFTYAAWEETLDAVRALLAEQSFAHARVSGDVAVYPDERAVDVTVRVEAGPAAKFGEVRIEGLERVPEALVREVVTIRPGEGFRASALGATRSALYGLRVFGVVDVLPDLRDPTASVVPVVIRVSEAKWREARLGPVIALESGKASVAARGRYRDDNVAGRLWRAEVDATVGAGVRLDTWEAVREARLADIAPVGDVSARAELPRLGATDVAFLVEGRVALGLDARYRNVTANLAPALTYTGLPRLRPAVGYRLEYGNYWDLAVALDDLEESRFRIELVNPELLSMLEQKLVYDGRNDPLQTTRGWYWSVAVAEAGLGGTSAFVRGQGEVRAWRGIVDLFGWDPEIVFAGRLAAGVARALGDGETARVPYEQRFLLGGSNTVRGWGADRLGPYLCLPPEEEGGDEGCADDITRQVPVGGLLQTYGNVEVRKGLPYDLVLAMFADVGGVWDRPAGFEVGELQWSVGGGLRYPTPVGPVRVDLGVRLGDSDYFEAHRWQVHLSLGEAY
jgi:outer membrane protein assembly factor BamA